MRGFMGSAVVAVLAVVFCASGMSATDVDPPFEHVEVYAWYFGTIDTNATSIGSCPPAQIDTSWYAARGQQGFVGSSLGT